MKDNKNFQVVKDVPNLDTIRGPRLGFDYLDIDNQREPFNKLEVRQALQYALDRDEFLAVCTSGLGTLISPVPPALKDYTLDPKSFPEYKQDLNKAKELLAKAGVPNGFKTSIDIIPQFATMVTGAQVLADQLKKIGIELEIKQYEYGVWLDRFNAHQFDLAWNVTGGNADPDPLLRSRLHSKIGSNQNNSTDTEIDKLLEEGKAITDLAKRKEHYANVQKVLVQKCAADLDVLGRPDPRHEEDGQGVRVAPVQLLPGPGGRLARRLATAWGARPGRGSAPPLLRSPTSRG